MRDPKRTNDGVVADGLCEWLHYQNTESLHHQVTLSRPSSLEGGLLLNDIHGNPLINIHL